MFRDEVLKVYHISLPSEEVFDFDGSQAASDRLNVLLNLKYCICPGTPAEITALMPFYHNMNRQRKGGCRVTTAGLTADRMPLWLPP